MVREIGSHIFGSGKQSVVVREFGEGRYLILVHHGDSKKPVEKVVIHFQEGAGAPANGVTVESLIAVCLDRLTGFQAEHLACTENSRAIDALCVAMQSLHTRTERRSSLGIEGTMRTCEEVQAEKVQALADRAAVVSGIMCKCNASEPVTAEELGILEATRGDGSLSLVSRNRITDALVKADLGGLLIDSEV